MAICQGCYNSSMSDQGVRLDGIQTSFQLGCIVFYSPFPLPLIVHLFCNKNDCICIFVLQIQYANYCICIKFANLYLHKLLYFYCIAIKIIVLVYLCLSVLAKCQVPLRCGIKCLWIWSLHTCLFLCESLLSCIVTEYVW